MLCAALATTAAAAGAQDLDNRSGEQYDRIWFVPRLGGAVSFEGGLVQPLGRNTSTGYPTTWFAGVGWKHYLEGHGRLQLRFMATYEHGGVLNPAIEGTSNRIGASFAVTVRGITQDWLFGQLTALVDASYITLRAPSGPFVREREQLLTGGQFGGGLETTFGSMFMLDPYLMAETGASITANWVDIGGVGAVEVWGRWIVRFDIGVRNADDGPGTYSKPTVSSP